MTQPYVAYGAAAGQRDFDVPFPYINRSHVKVRVNGAPVSPFSWPSAGRLRLSAGVPEGSVVEIERQTPVEEQLVKFQDGNILTAEDLNVAVLQLLYTQQEVAGLYDRSLRKAQVRVGENLGIVTNPEAVSQELAELVLEEEVLDTFRQRIADIDLNAESILAQAFELSRVNAAVTAAEGLIASVETSANGSFAALNTQISGVDTRLATLRADHQSLVGMVDALAGGDAGTGIATLIQNEQAARVDGDQALASTISLIGAKSADGLSFVLDGTTTLVSPSETLAQRLNTISASSAANAASVTTERNARISADTALADSLSLLDARVGSAEAAVLSETAARVSGDSALSSSLTALTGRVGDAEASLISDRQARVDGDAALVTELDGLKTRVGTAEASLVSDRQARVSGDAALASDLGALTARVGTAESAIVTNKTAAADASSAIASELALLGAKNGANNAFVINTATAQIGGGVTLASRFSALTAADGNNLSLIQSEEQARISADNVLTSSVNSLGSRMGTAEAAIVTEQNARAAGDAAEASARQALASRVTNAEAAITNEQNARASGDNAIASDLALLGVKNAGGTAWVLDMSKVQVDANTSLGTRLSGIDTSLGNNAAAVVNEQNARASADSALSQNISTLTTTVNGNTASISTLSSSVNGLSARYGVSLDVNGYVTGFVQNNNGTSGSFTILADKFAIVAPGANPTVPFEVSGGVVRIKEANIGTLNIGKLTSGVLTAGVTQNADWNVGTGRIIWDNGTHMKVAGVGFGSNGQFIEWFGPKMDIELCSESNAITFLKTNGDAYFGGRLSAGTISNAIQTTTLGDTAAVLGPFSTPGRPASVVCGASTGYIIATDTTAWPAGEPPPDPYAGSRQQFSVSYALERAATVNGPWTVVTNYTAFATSGTEAINAGTQTINGEPTSMRRYRHFAQIGVSGTTALQLAAGDAVLRLRRTSFQNLTLNQAASPNSSNNISVRYTEE